MKKIILIFMIFVGSKTLTAQSYMNLSTYQDTANYLIHEIEMKKHLFKDKSFTVLLDSLKVDPVLVMLSGYNGRNVDYYGKALCFDFNFTTVFDNQHFIIVKYSSAPDYTTLKPLFAPFNPANFTQILNLYKPLIVTDVRVKDYTDDEPQRPGITDNSGL